MNAQASQPKPELSWLGRAIVLGCLLLLAYGWYLQQQSKPFELAKKQQMSIELPSFSANVSMTKVSLPPPPPMPMATAKPEPKVKPQPRTQLQSPLKAKPKVEDKVEDKVQHKPQKTIVDVSSNNQSQLNTEPLLQQLESGKGPLIEIAWPQGLAKRQQLFTQLVDCLGVGLGALVGSQVKQIYGEPLQYSRLVRMVSGQMVAREQQIQRQADVNGVPVRLFPRDLDGRLLAGLAYLAAAPIQHFQSIHGEYLLRGRQLYVTKLSFDGRLKSGEILLSKGSCRK